jgi:hypothetical protein
MGIDRLGRRHQSIYSFFYGQPCSKLMLRMEPFEHHCARCFMIYHLLVWHWSHWPVQTSYISFTEHDPIRKKFVNFNFERFSKGLCFMVEGFFNPEVVKRIFTVSVIIIIVVLIKGYFIWIIYNTSSWNLE